MTVVQEQRYFSPEEYLELEINSQERHEYINGKIITMSNLKLLSQISTITLSLNQKNRQQNDNG